MVSQVMQALKPDWVINAAAYTAVDKAEQETQAADLINAGGIAVHNQTDSTCWGNNSSLRIAVTIFFTELNGIIPSFGCCFYH
mgnify:CR=1 FL=1